MVKSYIRRELAGYSDPTVRVSETARGRIRCYWCRCAAAAPVGEQVVAEPGANRVFLMGRLGK